MPFCDDFLQAEIDGRPMAVDSEICEQSEQGSVSSLVKHDLLQMQINLLQPNEPMLWTFSEKIIMIMK
jgi:hypothetical protein